MERFDRGREMCQSKSAGKPMGFRSLYLLIAPLCQEL